MEEKAEKWEDPVHKKDPANENICPTCKRSYHIPHPHTPQNVPVLPPQYPPPHAPRFSPSSIPPNALPFGSQVAIPYAPPYSLQYSPRYEKRKKYFGLTLGVWVVILIITLIAVMIGFGIYIDPFEPHEEVNHYTFEVIIAEGGHYRYTLKGYYWDEYEITMNISSLDGNRFDVYIMDKDQYESAYGNANSLSIAFSVLYSSENIAHLDETITIPEWDWSPIYIVMDNRDTPLTANDATPEGTITLDVHIVERSVYEYD